jgi:hypothetical protein
MGMDEERIDVSPADGGPPMMEHHVRHDKVCRLMIAASRGPTDLLGVQGIDLGDERFRLRPRPNSRQAWRS